MESASGTLIQIQAESIRLVLARDQAVTRADQARSQLTTAAAVATAVRGELEQTVQSSFLGIVLDELLGRASDAS